MFFNFYACPFKENKKKQIYIQALFFQLTCLFFLQFILYD